MNHDCTLTVPNISSFICPPPNSFFTVALVAAYSIFSLTCVRRDTVDMVREGSRGPVTSIPLAPDGHCHLLPQCSAFPKLSLWVTSSACHPFHMQLKPQLVLSFETHPWEPACSRSTTRNNVTSMCLLTTGCSDYTNTHKNKYIKTDTETPDSLREQKALCSYWHYKL